MLEWDSDFDLAVYEAMNKGPGSTFCQTVVSFASLVGSKAGRGVIEVWETSDDAGRFNEKNGHLVAEFNIPAPSQVSTFDTITFQNTRP